MTYSNTLPLRSGRDVWAGLVPCGFCNHGGDADLVDLEELERAQ